MTARCCAAAILVIALVAGCATVPGRPIPIGPSGTSQAYRDKIGVGGRANLEYSDAMQQLDPCGFVDAGTIESWGDPIHFGNGRTLDECEILFADPVTDKRISSVEVSQGVSNYRQGLQVQLQSGVVVSEIPDVGSCSVFVQFDERQSFHYYVAGGSVEGSLSLGPPSGAPDTCREAERLVNSSVPLLATRPLRKNSLRVVPTAAATADACAALNEFESDTVLLVNDGGMQGLGTCDFYLTDRIEETRQTITIDEVASSSVEYPSSSSNPLLILGVPASEDELLGDDWCSIRVFVGAGDSYSVQVNNDQFEDRIDSIEVHGHGCTSVRATALAATRQYLSR